MHRIDTNTAQKDKFGAGKNGFTRGNPQTGTPATDLDDDYFDMLQEELAGVVEAAGIVLDKSKHNQLLTALTALFLSREHPFADIKADGATAISEALSNLGVIVTSGPTYLTVKIGAFIIMTGNCSNTTSSEGNLNVTFPFAFPNRVFYMNIAQANSSYASDVDPLIYSPYAAPSAGPITALGASVRNTKTGASQSNKSVSARYIAVGY